MAETTTSDKTVARKPSRGELLKLGKELGITLAEDEYSRLLDRAKAAEDPAGFLREFVAEKSESLPPSVSPSLRPAAEGATEVTRDGETERRGFAVPLADLPEHYHRFSQLNVNLARETKLKETITRLYHGLRGANERIDPREPGEPPRVIESVADAVKWLIQEVGKGNIQ